MSYKPYNPLPNGHPDDVVWLTLLHALFRNVYDDEAEGRPEYRFRVPAKLAGPTHLFCTPVPLRLARRLLMEQHRTEMQPDASGKVQSDALRTVPSYAQAQIPPDWPERLTKAGLRNGSAHLYSDADPGAPLPKIDPEVARARAQEAEEDAAMERGRRMVEIVGVEAVRKMIDAGELPEALLDELAADAGGPKAAAAKIHGQSNWRDVVAAIEGCDDPTVLAEVRALEESRARPRASVLAALDPAEETEEKGADEAPVEIDRLDP